MYIWDEFEGEIMEKSEQNTNYHNVGRWICRWEAFRHHNRIIRTNQKLRGQSIPQNTPERDLTTSKKLTKMLLT